MLQPVAAWTEVKRATTTEYSRTISVSGLSRYAVSPVLVGLAVWITASLSGAETTNTSKAESAAGDVVVLQLPFTHQFQFAGYYAAAEKGYYRQEGLRVVIKEGTRDRLPTELVLSGRANFGTVGSGLLYERLHGKPVVALAAIFQHSAKALMVRRDSGIVSARDLVGRRVMVELNARDAEFHALFKRERIDEVTLKLIRSDWSYADLINGKVDAVGTYITTGPQQMQARGIAVTLIRPLGYGLDFYGDCLFTSEREISTNPGRVGAFRRASLRGWSYAMDHPDEVIEMILNRYGGRARGLTRENLRLEAEAMRSLILPDLVEIGHMNAARWGRMAMTYRELGMVERSDSLQGFLYNPDPMPDLRWMYWAGGAIVTVGLVAGLIVCWNARLRQKVREHTCALKLRNDELRREVEVRQRAETTLRRSEQRFRDLFVSSPDAIFVEDLDGTVLDVNSAACELHGMNRSELLGKNVCELVPAHWREQVRRDFPRLVSGEVDCVDGFSLRTSGESIPVEIRASRFEFDGRAALLLHVRDITERKRASETLRAALQFNEQIISGAGEGIVVYDRNLRCVVWNRFMEELTGLPATSVLGQCALDLFPHIREHGIDEQFRRTLAGERTSTLDFPFRIASTGRSGWAIATHEPQRDAKGEIIGVVSVITDMTERRRAQEALRESEARFYAAFESAAIGMALVGTDGRWIKVNRALCELVGYTEKEMQARTFQDITHPEDLAADMAYVQQILSGTIRTYQMEKRYLHKKGHVVWIQLNVTLVRDAKGAPLHFVSQIQDISERKRVEEALRAAGQFNEQIISSAGEGIVVYDSKLRYVVWNPFMEQLTGMPASEVLGRSALELFPHIREHGIDELIKRAIAGERTKTADILIRIPQTGKSAWITSTYEPHRNPKGETIGVVAVVTDITERKRLEEQLRQSQKMDAVGQLGGGIAHDFNNLMAAVIGFSELSLARLASHPVSHYVVEMKKAAERAAALTRQLLAFSRKQVLEPKILNLNTVVENIGQMLRRLIREDIELRIIPAPRLGCVRADLGQIEQVIINLTVNARDAMPECGILTIRTDEVLLDEEYVRENPELVPGLYVMLSVSDTGIGMSEEVKARVFEPFFTTKPRGQGTGLGLATSYGIVQQSGGHITVESEPGRGTTFRVYLPRVEGTPASAPVSHPSKPDLRGTETVLLVEDEPALRELNSLVLREEGYTVIEASNGVEALNLAEQHRGEIHLLLTDVVMPQMGGAELATRLQHRYPHAKVLFTSGYAEESISRHGVLEPGIAFLPKPFLSSALAIKVRQVLDNGHAGHNGGNGCNGKSRGNTQLLAEGL